MRKRDFIFSGIIILLLSLLFVFRGRIEEGKRLINDYEVKYSEINGKQQASIEILEFNSERDFKNLKSKDSIINRLQELQEVYKGRLNTLTGVVISLQESGSSLTIIERDTVIVGDSIAVYPVYITEWSERWSNGRIRASKDSIWRSFEVIDDIDIIHGYKSSGLFKKKVLTVDVVSNNPNSKVKDLKSVQFKLKQNRFGFGINTGVGIDFISLKPCIYLGVGGHLRIF